MIKVNTSRIDWQDNTDYEVDVNKKDANGRIYPRVQVGMVFHYGEDDEFEVTKVNRAHTRCVMRKTEVRINKNGEAKFKESENVYSISEKESGEFINLKPNIYYVPGYFVTDAINFNKFYPDY